MFGMKKRREKRLALLEKNRLPAPYDAFSKKYDEFERDNDTVSIVRVSSPNHTVGRVRAADDGFIAISGFDGEVGVFNSPDTAAMEVAELYIEGTKDWEERYTEKERNINAMHQWMVTE